MSSKLSNVKLDCYLTLQVELSTPQLGVSQGGQRRVMYQVGRRVHHEASGEGLDQHS